MYPQFVCLPPLGSNEPEPGEIILLDHLTVTHLGRGCECTKLSLQPEVFQLVRDQMLFILGGGQSEYMKVVMETAREALPLELRKGKGMT